MVGIILRINQSPHSIVLHRVTSYLHRTGSGAVTQKSLNRSLSIRHQSTTKYAMPGVSATIFKQTVRKHTVSYGTSSFMSSRIKQRVLLCYEVHCTGNHTMAHIVLGSGHVGLLGRRGVSILSTGFLRPGAVRL